VQRKRDLEKEVESKMIRKRCPKDERIERRAGAMSCGDYGTGLEDAPGFASRAYGGLVEAVVKYHDNSVGRGNLHYFSRVSVPVSIATLIAVCGGLLFDSCVGKSLDTGQLHSAQGAVEVREVDGSDSQLEIFGDSVVKGGRE